MLGNAAGTTARAYGRFFPRTWIDGVEIDPELPRSAASFFGMTNPRLRSTTRTRARCCAAPTSATT